MMVTSETVFFYVNSSTKNIFVAKFSLCFRGREGGGDHTALLSAV